MPAFFKRRWILLSCALALVACVVSDFTIVCIRDGWHAGTLGAYLICARSDSMPDPIGDMVNFPWQTSGPTFGELRPVFIKRQHDMFLAIPVWIPLVAVLGWLTFRELRWREKRARAAEVLPSASS